MKMFPIVIMSRFPCHLERAKRVERSDKSLGNQNLIVENLCSLILLYMWIVLIPLLMLRLQMMI